MLLQMSPNRWSCLPNSFANALEVPISDIFDFVGHDGSEIIWPELSEPFCRRSFHIQEMIAYAHYCHKLSITEFQAIYGSVPSQSNTNPFKRRSPYLESLLMGENYIGVLTGFYHQMAHAVAWNGYEKLIYDGSRKYTIDNFNIQSFWRFSEK